jgi:hypothetical protein
LDKPVKIASSLIRKEAKKTSQHASQNKYIRILLSLYISILEKERFRKQALLRAISQKIDIPNTKLKPTPLLHPNDFSQQPIVVIGSVGKYTIKCII